LHPAINRVAAKAFPLNDGIRGPARTCRMEEAMPPVA